MPTVYVNDMPLEIGSQKLNCVQAAGQAGELIPHYCYHEALSVVASCRMCLVEVGELKDGKVIMQQKVVPGCQTSVKDGTVIVTGEYAQRSKDHSTLLYDPAYKPGERAKKAQADTLEGLLLNHPLDCPVCDKAGECLLQDYSYQYGRSESRLADPKNTPPNKPHISSKITLFTDRCILCTRCVRFTREISGTSELLVVGRGDHSEIDIFPGQPLENKLSGNVVDLCPVGALAAKDFLYSQRVWYLKTGDSICPNCSTGCSIHVDTNKEIVYRVRPRPTPQAEAGGHFICDEGRWGYHYVTDSNRLVQPLMRHEGGLKARPWSVVLPKLKNAITEAILIAPKRVTVVLSPFLTVEEAYLLGAAFKTMSDLVRLVLGPIPIVGEDDKYPKGVKGHHVEPTKFTIRAEKCPNRRGVEAVLRHFQGEVIPFTAVASDASNLAALWFAGGYPDLAAVNQSIGEKWNAPNLLIVQDFFPTNLSQVATYLIPATAACEKEGTFINHAKLVQTFPRAVRPPAEVRSESQLGFDLLNRAGLANIPAVRKELARAIPEFQSLAHEQTTTQGTRLQLATV